MKPTHDGAVPSGNSVAALVLLRIAKLLDNDEYARRAEAILTSMGAAMHEQPRAYLNLICAADFTLRPGPEIALVGKRSSRDTAELMEVIHRKFLPNKVLAFVEPGSSEKVAERIPLLAGKSMVSGKATAYVCENFACKQPVSDPKTLKEMLGGIR